MTEDDARRQLSLALQDVAADYGEVSDDMVVDLLASLALDWPADVAAEVCRTELGFIPRDLQRHRPDIQLGGAIDW